jgi:hypothetical protein
MPKTNLPFNPAEYALVADRLSLFYEKHPQGRIFTELVSRDRDVVFRAEVYRHIDDAVPSATGWASEREGDGDVNSVACLENTETSAVGRALANLGYTASARRPSYEEMQKADRERRRLGNETAPRAPGGQTAPLRVAESKGTPADAATVGAPVPAPNEQVADVLALLDEAARKGVPANVIATYRRRIADGSFTRSGLDQIARQVRHWLRAGFRPSSHPGSATGERGAVHS